MGIQDFYKSTASVLSPSAAGTFGDITYGTASTVTGMLRPMRGTQTYTAGKEDIQFTHKFYCAASADIAEEDRLLIDAVTYDVVVSVDPNSLGHHQEVLLIRNNGV